MKQIFTLLLSVSFFSTFAQAPVIEGTYYPVRNTSIKQVWDTTYNSMSVPTLGPNQVWDYRFSNNQFTHRVDTFRFKFLDKTATPYAQYFPNATHATFVRTPFNNIADSLYSYWEVTPDALYSVGGFNIQQNYDSTITYSKKEFYAPSVISYPMSRTDTSKFVAYAKNLFNHPFKIKGRKIKTYSYVGYGTLMIPNGTYNKVALVRGSSTELDSLYIDWTSNGNYSYVGTSTTTAVEYSFLRNNTFGSAYLMYLSAGSPTSGISYGWYTLPVDFGSISGSVFTNTTETTPVTNGEMYLYRENSNFAKNDILARTQLKPNGTFQFDSIPYGEYRIAVRPNLTAYPNSKITYYGDTTNWIDASTIITTTTTSVGHKIHLQYHPAPAGTSTITGVLGLNYNFGRGNNMSVVSKPVPGIGIIVKKNPGGSASRVGVTDTSGVFNLGALDNGNYELFVDIPGMHMTGTYSFVVSGNNTFSGLDFTVGKDSIHPISAAIGIKEISKNNDSKVSMSAFPNPYNGYSNIEVKLAQSSDVELSVYNMLGEKVQTLDRSRKDAGEHYYKFSAKEIGAPSGIYFVKLKAGNTSRVLKVIEQQ